MKRTLQIAIDANRVTCGKCEHRSPFAASLPQLPACTLFMQPLYATTDYQRCAPCLAAEREAGDEPTPDSPNFTPPGLVAFAATGFKRIRRTRT